MYSLETMKKIQQDSISKSKSIEPYEAVINKDEGVFKCPAKARKIKGFNFIKRYFVDNSGFGTQGEMALTASEFLEKVEKGKFYAIISQGQFQVYIGEFERSK